VIGRLGPQLNRAHTPAVQAFDPLGGGHDWLKAVGGGEGGERGSSHRFGEL
jgi:hypothetical protein